MKILAFIIGSAIGIMIGAAFHEPTKDPITEQRLITEDIASLDDDIKAVQIETMTDEEYDIMVDGMQTKLNNINDKLDILIKWCEDNKDECEKSVTSD